MKKNVRMHIFFRLYCAFFLVFVPSLLQSETIRDRAAVHFDLVRWTASGPISLVTRDSGIIPGGSETFAVLGADRDTGVPAIYPSIPELGILDYSGIDQGLIDLLAKFSAGLKKLKIDGALCYPNRPFIPVIANYQLERLPEPDQSFFSRPVMDASGLYDVQLLLRFPSAKESDGSSKSESAPRSLVVHVKVGLAQGNWYVCEIYFDGETYAVLARKN
jgi:hypothetical protein